VNLTLAAYNAGAGAVARSSGVPRYAERKTTCAGSRTSTTEVRISVQHLDVPTIPFGFNEMRGACFTSATPTKFSASV